MKITSENQRRNDLDYGVISDLSVGMDVANTQSGDSREPQEFNDNFFGDGNMDAQDMSKHDTDKPDEERDLDDNKMKNPFFVSLKGGPVLYMKNRNLYTRYKRCLLLCKQDEYDDVNLFSIPNLAKKIVTKDQFVKLSKYMVLIEGNIRIVKNNYHKKQSVIVDRHMLTHFNHLNLDLENDEIVVPLFEQTKSTCMKLYMPLYTYQYTIEDVVRIKMLYDYYNCKVHNVHVNKRYNDIFSMLEDTNYWTNDYNCKLNMTKAFLERAFQYKERNKNVKTSVVIRNSGNSKADKFIESILSPNSGVNNYELPVEIKKDFVDASTAIKNDTSDYKLYKISNATPSLTKEQVAELFAVTTDQREKYNLFNAFLLSKVHCHLVVNNAPVLENMSGLIEKLSPVYRYIFGYAWLTMYMEECIVKTRSTTNHRFVFDINTANKLPVFPYSTEDPHLNPYFTLLVDKKSFDPSNNCHGLPMIKNYNKYGIDTLDGFRKKFNIFTTGREDMSIFDGLETEDGSNKWKHFAVGGSLIPSCAEKRNPLIEQLVKPDMSFRDQWSRFFDEYHNNSDIDLMCNKKSVFGFMDEVSKLIQLVGTNLNELTGKDVTKTIEVEPIKSLQVVINSKYIEECMQEYEYNYVIENIDSNEIKEALYEKYVSSKFKMNKKMRTSTKDSENKLYEHFLKLSSVDDMNVRLEFDTKYYGTQFNSDSDYCFYLNDVRDTKVPAEENIQLLRISEHIKFKIKSPHLLHSIEVFRTKFDEFFSCVSRFHLPCVRGYYDGNNVYLMPSCITALMTHVNIDYKYFAGIRDPIDIVNKYRMRGIGTIINNVEKAHMLKYNTDIVDDKWKAIFGLTGTKIANKNKHFKPVKIGDNMYKPSKFLEGYPDDVYHDYVGSYIESPYDMYGSSVTHNAVDFLKFKTINENGGVTPFKKWILDAGYDCLANSV